MTENQNAQQPVDATGAKNQPDHPQTELTEKDIQQILQTRDIDLLKTPATPISNPLG